MPADLSQRTFFHIFQHLFSFLGCVLLGYSWPPSAHSPPQFHVFDLIQHEFFLFFLSISLVLGIPIPLPNRSFSHSHCIITQSGLSCHFFIILVTSYHLPNSLVDSAFHSFPLPIARLVLGLYKHTPLSDVDVPHLIAPYRVQCRTPLHCIHLSLYILFGSHDRRGDERSPCF